MKIRSDALEYVKEKQTELIELIQQLCSIASFSHHEQKKAAFIQNWFKQYGIETKIDEVYNVILEIQAEQKENLVVFAAHIDTVFPDEIGFDCIEKEGFLYAPGVGDDTANVAELMLMARYIVQNKLNCNSGCLIVFNSGEEGLGNLKGSRYLFESYKDQIQEFYSFDGTYQSIVNKAVGSSRYQVTVKTEGGHSYGAFGNKNAIACAASLISVLYDYKVPSRGVSTYNVGVIEGGTSVNTIAQNAEFTFEYRSDHHEDLLEMNQFFHQCLETYRSMGCEIELKLLGERPCMGNVNPTFMEKSLNHAVEVIHHFTASTPKIKSGSTDCNIAYFHGVAGCCFGGYLGQGAHTREEKVSIDSLVTGMQIIATFMLAYFD